MALTISQDDLVKLKTGLSDNLQKLNPPAGKKAELNVALDLDDLKKDFCAVWPEAKKVIEAISPFIGWVPTAQTLLTVLKDAGDVAAKGLNCPGF